MDESRSATLTRIFDDSRVDAYLLSCDLAALDALLGVPGIDARDRSGRTVLMRAAGEGNLLVVAHLLGAGADASLIDVQGRTALHYAAVAGADGVAELLCDSGTPLEARDSAGRTALWHAAAHNLPESAIVDVLLTRGANPKARDERGICPDDLM